MSHECPIKKLDTVLKWAYSANSCEIRVSKRQMQNNEKPIVFLSHSSLDKAPLTALKTLLDERAAGGLNFFLSSDGESIRFGRNWVVSISDALAKAELMFVFLSAHSADSKWIHFEAGCASGKGIEVVPVCLPGIDLNRISPPLSLLHGFNLHSCEAMGNLARICNDKFQRKIPETFSREDFNNSIGNIIGHGAGYFGEQSWAIDKIEVKITKKLSDLSYNPIPAFDEICKKAGMNCFATTTEEGNEALYAQFEQPGCLIEFAHREDSDERSERVRGNRMRETTGAAPIKPKPIDYVFKCTLSPELFHINAPLLDRWLMQAGIGTPLSVSVFFNKQIDLENQRHRLTTKLYQCGINLVGLNKSSGFVFDGKKFNIEPYGKIPYLWFSLDEKLEDKRLATIIERLFKSQVLWVHEPDPNEMFQG
jgi:hypothetical protein